MKKITVLLVLMLFSLFPVNVSAADVNTLSTGSAINAGLFGILVIYLIGLSLGILLYYAGNYANFHINKSNPFTPAIYIYLTGLITRLIISVVMDGHPIDMGCFKGWASIAANNLPSFYTNGGFADYPPLYIYVLFIVEKIRLLLFASSPEFVRTLIIKLPANIADVVCSYIIFKYGKRYLNEKKAMLISLIYLFNPATILTSSVWGQVDSIFMLILSIALIKLTDKDFIKSTVWFALAVLFKPQGLIFLPVLFFVLVKEKNIKLLGKCFLTGLVTFILPIIPFSGGQRFDWILKLYFNTASSYKGASINAYNLFALLGANWKDDTQKLFIFSYSTWGFIFIGLVTLLIAWYILTSKNESIPASSSVMLITGVYVLSSKMHERYIFPALMLLLLVYVVNKKTEVLLLHIGFSITALVNVLQVFILSQSKIYWVPANNSTLKFISFINIVLMIVTFAVIISLRFFIVSMARKATATSSNSKKVHKKGRKK